MTTNPTPPAGPIPGPTEPTRYQRVDFTRERELWMREPKGIYDVTRGQILTYIEAALAAERRAADLAAEVKRQNEQLLNASREIGEKLPLNVPHRSIVDAIRWFHARLAEVEGELRQTDLANIELAAKLKLEQAARDAAVAEGKAKAVTDAYEDAAKVADRIAEGYERAAVAVTTKDEAGTDYANELRNRGSVAKVIAAAVRNRAALLAGPGNEGIPLASGDADRSQ